MAYLSSKNRDMRCQSEAATKIAPIGMRKNHAIASREKSISSNCNAPMTHSRPINANTNAQISDTFTRAILPQAVPSWR